MSKAFCSIRVVTIAALVVFLGLAAAQQESRPAHAAFTDSDGDFAPDIGEFLVGSDPFDANSFPESTGAVFIYDEPLLCSDGIDNDLDGLTDGDDPFCVDSDGDFASDPLEALVGSDPNDAASTPEDTRVDLVVGLGLQLPPVCNDGLDNDGDGLTDEDDPGCAPIDGDGDGFDDAIEKMFASDPSDAASTPEHEVPNPGSCDDGLDNDLDGLTDNADIGCDRATNDSFADATSITTLPFSDSAKVIDATVGAEEPTPSCATSGLERTVWYAFTATEDTLLSADTLGTDFDPVLSVWTDSGAGLVEVACNDDIISVDFTGVVNLQSRVAIRAAAGETYFFLVGRFGIDVAEPPKSSLVFNLGAGVPVANDEVTTAATIDTLPFTDGPREITNATNDPEETTSSCAFGAVFSTVWYQFTPTEKTLLTVDTFGTDFETILAVWTESPSGYDQVNCVNAFRDPESAEITFQAAVGETYFIQVSQIGWFGPRGLSLVLNVAGEPVPEPPDEGESGDANCDGTVNAIDAALVLQVSAGLLGAAPCTDGADVNGDGNITSVDAALILQFTAGLLSSLPS